MDEPVTFPGGPQGDWKPQNADHKFYGPTTLREGLTYSRNVVTVKLLDAIGISKVLDFARAIGIEGDMPRDLTLALGSLSVTPFDLALYYSVFADGGNKISPVSLNILPMQEAGYSRAMNPRPKKLSVPRQRFS